MNLIDSLGNIISDAQFRVANPQSSFPTPLREDCVEPYGYHIIQEVSAPAPSAFYRVSEGAPTLINGVWTQTWVTTPVPLAEAQTTQIDIMATLCGLAITSGFKSSALGTVHTYPSKMTDQQNLAASVLASVLPSSSASGWTTPFWCEDSSGTWAWVQHTAAQIQQVGTDGINQILAYQAKNAQLKAQILAAIAVEDVEAIVWS